MSVLVVIENPEHWDLSIPGVEVVAARAYLSDPAWSRRRGAKVFNLCKSYGYHSVGYYVSLLAAARGHRPLPSVATLQDLTLGQMLKHVSGELGALIDKSLHGLESDRFVLSVYFGRNVAKRYDRLSKALFNHFPAPFLRAEMARMKGEWRLARIRPIATDEIPESHREIAIENALRFFERPRYTRRRRARYDLAILVDPEAEEPPSDERAIKRMVRAARALNIDATVIGKEDFGRLAEFDALFIRETTSVPHHTYRFARRAEAEGLVVIDDPESILRCTNKVYQAEMFAREKIPSPKTLVVHRDNRDQVGPQLGFPCVLKQPDSAFSLGVTKVRDEAELRSALDELLESSELIVAQAFTPSEFDWRIGVLDGQALYACKYHMARGHWQILKSTASGRRAFGKVETIPIEAAPKKAVELAVRACRPIGDGLYGVDLKEIAGRFLMIEVNDNPSLDAGYEDAVLEDELYRAIMRSFLARIERRGVAASPS